MKRIVYFATVVGMCLVVVLIGCGRQGESPAGQAASPAASSAPEAAIAQALCPVMGMGIDKNVFVDYDGRRIYFCCSGCVGKFKADPQTYIRKVDEQLSASAGPAHDAGGHAGHMH